MMDVLALFILPVCVFVQMRAVVVLIGRIEMAVMDWIVIHSGGKVGGVIDRGSDAGDQPRLMMRVVFEVQGIEFVRNIPAGVTRLVVPVGAPGYLKLSEYVNSFECVPRGDGLAVVFVPEKIRAAWHHE